MHPITRNHVRPRRSALRAGRLASGLLAVVLAAGAAGLANAQGVQPFATKPRSSVAPDRCLALSHNIGPRALIQKASWRLAQAADQGTGGGTAPTVGGLKPTEARLSFIGHSTFLIESAKGITIATDYNDIYRARTIPTIATMNITHSTHHSYAPQEGIRHILRGWGAEGAPAIHDLTVQDVRVRNIPTNTRAWDENGTRRFGNSIFVFEIAGLCIAHLGHLHHTLTVQQLAQIGQMDVVLVPVDGSYTLDIDGMVEVLKALKAPLIVPMHYFSRFTLERFLSAARPHFEVVESPVPTTVLSRDVLPLRQRVLVLPGE